MKTITPCLWFNGDAEAAVNFYVSVFPNARIGGMARYGEGMPLPAGTPLTIDFELNGRPFTALNGGPEFKFNEAVSFVVPCESQAEIDALWTALGEGGQEQMCGWLKDRFGVSWQIVPTALERLMQSADPERAQRVTQALLRMVKLDIAALEAAYRGDA